MSRVYCEVRTERLHTILVTVTLSEFRINSDYKIVIDTKNAQ